MKKTILVIAAAMACLSASAQKWTSLFNGSDLSGWKTGNGPAVYCVENGCIKGVYNSGKGNSFLVSEQNYSDFILEFEFKMQDPTNSGVQFRGHRREDGRVYGYQYEFDGSDRAWTGGIYDEARRGWLYPLTFNKEAGKAYINEDWNKGRIEAVGNHIRTYVNGVLASDLTDDMDSEGFIGLQVHGPYGTRQIAGKAIWWKNIRICTVNPGKYLLKTKQEVCKVNSMLNKLTDEQVADGWKLLWDGQTSNGWISARTGARTLPACWYIEDGELCVMAKDGREAANGGDIFTEKQYENFWLSVDFKITKGANSGIKYFVRPDLYETDASAIGCEFQILDDEVHPDAKLGTAGNRTLGSLYDLIKADKTDAWFRKGQWNTAWVKVDGNHVEHWLNGVKILEYERNTQMFNALVQCSKYKDWKNFGNHDKGHLLLQDHGNEVHFKNIIIKEL